MNDYDFIQEYNSNLFDEFIEEDIVTILRESFTQSLSSESYSYLAATANATTAAATFGGSIERPSKQQKHTNVQWIYGDLDGLVKPKDELISPGNTGIQDLSTKNVTKMSQGKKRDHATMTRTPLHAQDHVMAERKRREKLNERFIALSAIVPGLKKMDKASVLGGAIKYLKELRERVTDLEEQTKKKTVMSAVLMKKSVDDDSSSCDENFSGGYSDETLPEIEARVAGKDVLIRIHCEKHRGFLAKLLSEIENLQLSVVNSSFLPFGNSTVDIAITAQMDEEFSMTVNDLVKNLQLALLKFHP